MFGPCITSSNSPHFPSHPVVAGRPSDDLRGSPLGKGTVLLRGPVKSREAERHFGKAQTVLGRWWWWERPVGQFLRRTRGHAACEASEVSVFDRFLRYNLYSMQQTTVFPRVPPFLAFSAEPRWRRRACRTPRRRPMCAPRVASASARVVPRVVRSFSKGGRNVGGP